MHEISYAKYLASPKYRKFTFGGIIGWMLYGRYPTVEELQEQYAFTYYSTMNKAVTDVNNGSIGANEDAVKDTAVAGVYTDENGGKNVVLLKDHTESARIAPSVDMTINLGGHTLSSVAAVCIRVAGGIVTIDGRLPGSQIVANQESVGAICIQVNSTSTSKRVSIQGGTYISSCPVGQVEGVVNRGPSCEMYISDANIIVTSENGTTFGVNLITGTATISNCVISTSSSDGQTYSVYNEGSATISKCNISATSRDGTAWGVLLKNGTATISNCGITASSNGNSGGVINSGIAYISNSNIRTYSNYYKDGENFTASSRGVYNENGTLTMNDCYVMGTHCGLSNFGTLYVNGGTFEGYGHGGFYFSADSNTSYVCNAIIRDCEMPDGYTATANRNGAGFYFGECTNGQVYMDNCEINGIAASQIFVIKGTSNTLYISNSTVNNTNGGDANIRIDDGGNMLYIGRGNNFTADNTNHPGAVIVTDEVYVQGVA